MGGQHSLRGYIVQSLNAIIDSFNDNNWLTVTLEPNTESEKVDIKWTYEGNIKKVTQVKSSINIFKLRQARLWCSELESSTPNAEHYELALVGHPEESLKNTPKIGNVTIAPFKSLNLDSLLDEASTKIDKFYESHNKPKINASVRELLVKILVQEMNFNAIAGEEVKRIDFEQNLLGWMEKFEKQILLNPWSLFAPPESQTKKAIQNRIVEKILTLIGWNNFNEQELIAIFDNHTGKEIVHNLDYRGELESHLMDSTSDFILINSNHEISYGENSKEIIKRHLEKTQLFVTNFREKFYIPLKTHEKTNVFSILFSFSSDNDDLHRNHIYETKDYFKRDELDDNVEYYLIDNARSAFLISSIISAKNFRPELPVKFLYPITLLNSSPSKIGKRDLQLPPQYINSSIIPIVKESWDKISILLYCAEGYNQDYLKKLIWLIISLTSGYGNEYVIYFSDYDEKFGNEAKEVIRSFNDPQMSSKIIIKSYPRIESGALSEITVIQQPLQNQEFNESNIDKNNKNKILNRSFIEILPYGDVLMPFLKTDAITASDLKIFLSKKGIFVKNADRKRLVALLIALLFSPGELEDFKQMIDVKEKPVKASQEIYKLKTDIGIDEIIKNIIPVNPNILVHDTETKILGNITFTKNPENSFEYVLEIKTEKKDPTNYLSVNTLYGKISISCKIDNGNLLVNSIKTITNDDRVIAHRLLSAQKNNLIEKDIIEQDSIELLFSRFNSNKERVDFLLSFTNFKNSNILSKAEIRSIKYKFDKSQVIPANLKDRTERDIVTYLNGRDLGGLLEMSDDDFKSILLLDEIVITYTYDWLNLKDGLYNVKYNFSNSLYNKNSVEGTFRSEPTLIMLDKIKKLSNIDRLKRDLSNEIEKLKLAKLREYNII